MKKLLFISILIIGVVLTFSVYSTTSFSAHANSIPSLFNQSIASQEGPEEFTRNWMTYHCPYAEDNVYEGCRWCDPGGTQTCTQTCPPCQGD